MAISSRRTRQIVGLLLVATGVLLWLHRMTLVEWHPSPLGFWPWLLMLAGALRIHSRTLVSGVLLFALGLALATPPIRDLMTFDLLRRFWPLALIALGVMLIFKSKQPEGDSFELRRQSWHRSNGIALLRVLDLACDSPNYNGEGFITFMGAAKLDLRRARLSTAGARLEVVAFWGGVEVIVPPDWPVDMKVWTLMGGSENSVDTTRSIAPDEPRLVVTGAALMGGMEIRS